MAEHRIHWKEGGVIKYSWHRSHNRAITELCQIRKRLEASYDDINETDNIVRFDLSTATKPQLMDFLNEHVGEGPQCAA